MLDVTDRLNVEVLQFVQLLKGMVFGLFIRTEFERRRKGFSAHLNGQIVSRLVVVPVFGRQPHRRAVVSKTPENGVGCTAVVSCGYDGTDFFIGGPMVELLFHVGDRAFLLLLHIPTDTPFVFYRVRAFQQRYTGASFNSSHTVALLHYPPK